MPLPALTSRSRAAWEALAGVPVTFSPAVRVAVSPQSRLCPSGWIGLVVIADAAIATAPSPPLAQIVRQAVGALAPAALTDAGELSARLPAAELLGPASLAYLDASEFRPRQGQAVPEPLHPQARELGQFLSATDPADLDESGIEQTTSPAFAVREQGQIVAVAGYCDWPGQVAHLSVLTAAQARGRGLAGRAASAAITQAIREGKLPQWRARPETSRRVARGLGFRELGSQASIRLDATG